MTQQSCEEMRLLIQAEMDGELDAAGSAALAGHIATCEGCAGLQAALGDLSGKLRSGLTRHAAPPALRSAILAQAEAARPRAGRSRPRLSWRDGGWFGAGLAVAASLALVAVLPMASQPSVPGEEIVSAHVRALQPGHLLDVISTDKHTVKPWFDGKLDFAPPVKDLASQGFPLLGGRLDYIAGRSVAALVYRHGKHLIDLFVWPGSQGASQAVVQGYNLDAWSQNGMNFRAVSDLDPAELKDFGDLLRQ